jgi:hypothetical protein
MRLSANGLSLAWEIVLVVEKRNMRSLKAAIAAFEHAWSFLPMVIVKGNVFARTGTRGKRVELKEQPAWVISGSYVGADKTATDALIHSVLELNKVLMKELTAESSVVQCGGQTWHFRQ